MTTAARAPSASFSVGHRLRTESRLSVTSAVSRPHAVSFSAATPETHYLPASFGMPEVVPGSVVAPAPAGVAGADAAPARYRLRTESSWGMPASPYLPEQLTVRMRLRTESGVGMPVNPYLTALSAPSTMPGVTMHATAPGTTAPGALPPGVTVSSVGMPLAAAPQQIMVSPPPPPPTMPAPMIAAAPGPHGAPFIPGVAPAVAVDSAQMQPQVQRLQLTNLLGTHAMVAGGAPNGYAAYPQAMQWQPQVQMRTVQSPQHHLVTKPAVVSTRAAAVKTTPGPLDGPRTTVMLRNLPDGFTRDALLKLLDSEGFAGKYDFAYLPVDFDTLTGLNHAFVNLVSPAEAERLREHLEGFSGWAVKSDNVCAVAWNDRQQGLPALVERYRNSPVMHETVPDTCKPVIILSGRRAQFPPPTQKIKAPKILKGKH